MPRPIDAVPRPCVGVVALQGGSLLLVRRGHGPAGGSWSLPGGHIEFGETVEEAVVRELLEETGLVGVCDRFIGWTEIIDGDHHLVIMDFEVVVMADDDPVAGGDAAEVAWVPVESVTTYRLTDGLAEFLVDHAIIDAIA